MVHSTNVLLSAYTCARAGTNVLRVSGATSRAVYTDLRLDLARSGYTLFFVAGSPRLRELASCYAMCGTEVPQWYWQSVWCYALGTRCA
eukprot:3941039-Rhodomonas_salina.3